MSMFKIPFRNNRFLIISIIVTIIIQVLIVQFKPIGSFFHLNLLQIKDVFKLFALTVPLVLGMEIFKKVQNVNIKWNIKILLVKCYGLC